MARHFAIHTLLSREELDELETFAREPGRTVDACWDWMLAHGFKVSRAAVGTWKRHFSLSDRFAASSEAAKALMEAAKAGGTVAIADAATLQLGQMVFEKMIELQGGQEGGEVSTKDLWALSMSLKNVVQGGRHTQKLREEMAVALKVAEKDAREGASGEKVMAKLRELMGMPKG
jgi:hypothetical protein